MENSIFREKSMSEINSPEKLNEYIKVSSPGTWMIILAVIILIVGMAVWGTFSKIEVKGSDLSTSEIRPITLIMN